MSKRRRNAGLGPFFLLATAISFQPSAGRAQAKLTALEADVLGLKLGMPVAVLAKGMKAVGSGRVAYHFAETAFMGGKCVMRNPATGYSESLGSFILDAMVQGDAAAKAYPLITPDDSDRSKTYKCNSYLTDISYLDLVEKDGRRTVSAKYLSLAETDPQSFTSCGGVRVYKRARPSMDSPDFSVTEYEALPNEIIACDFVRVLLLPTFGDERATLISRTKVYRSNNPPFEEVLKGLLAKYGADPTYKENDTSPNRRSFLARWTFDAAGELQPPRAYGTTPCEPALSSQRENLLPPISRTVKSNCFVTLFIRITSLSDNPYLVESFSSALVNESAVLQALQTRETVYRRIQDEIAKAQATGSAAPRDKF